MTKLYIYLASRSKQGIKIITTLKGNKEVNSNLTNTTSLGLPVTWKNQIDRIIDEHKMLYEPRIESATNYLKLVEKLKTRGFTNIPNVEIPLLRLGNFAKAPKANTSSCKIKATMLRKKSF